MIPIPRPQEAPTGAIAFSDGTVFAGTGAGASGRRAAELVFNTAMTGYQEILTDPSYAEQVVLFTFPHIGNTGANPDDQEHSSARAERAAAGCVFRETATPASSWRSTGAFSDWLEARGIVGLSGVDTRAVTLKLRETGAAKVAIAHDPDGITDFDALIGLARDWSGIEAADLAAAVSTDAEQTHSEKLWTLAGGFGALAEAEADALHVVVVDFGVKRNILRNLSEAGARATVVPGTVSAEAVLAMEPDGVVLSNGPGDPAATIARAGGLVDGLLAAEVPLLGICLGHQLLALALGAQTRKMAQGHHGANHPVLDHQTGKVEIVSMNHEFTVDTDTLPSGVAASHTSLFDGTNCGIRIEGKPVLSVQHHPEASPGPQDSFYLFERFADMMRARKAG